MCGVRGELSIVLVSVAAVGGGEQPHIVGGGVAPTTIVTGWGKGVFSVKKRIFWITSFKISDSAEMIITITTS